LSVKSRLKRVVRHEGLSSTLHARSVWTGKPTLAAAGSGGSIPAGTHWYAAVLSKGGVDYWGGERASITCVANDKVTVSGITVPSGYTCRLYRNTDPSFPTPSLLSSNASFPYTDTAASPGTGTFDSKVAQPYEYFTDSSIHALQTALVRQDQQIVSGGKLIMADLKLMVAYDVAVTELDEITYNSIRYQIQYVDQPVARGSVQFKNLYCRRMVQ